MASMNKITDIIAAIKTIYPYYAKDTDIKTLAVMWAGLLKDYDDAAVEASMYKCLQICKQPPTPADVIEHIQAARKSQEMSDEDLWAIYVKALHDTARQMSCFEYTYVDESGVSQGDQARAKVEQIWQGLPEKIKHYLSAKSELMRNARENNFDSSFATWEKQRFLKAMPVMQKRQEYSALLLDGSSKFLLNGG